MNENRIIQGDLPVLGKSRKGLWLLFSWLFGAAALGLVSYYIWGPSPGEYFADTADTILWAQASLDAKSLLNPNFTYACFLPLGGHLLMLPFVALFGVSVTANLWGMFVFALLFAASLWFFLKSIPLSTAWSNVAAGLLLILLCASMKTREIFYGHIIYYSLGLFFAFWGLGLVCRGLRRLEAKPHAKQALPFCLLIFGCFGLGAVNQFEILALFCLPAIGALLCERFFFLAKPSPAEKFATWAVLLSAALGALVGNGIGALLVGGRTAAYASSFAEFSPPETWAANASLFFSHWSTLLGVSGGEASFSSPQGVEDLLRLAFAVMLLVFPVLLTLQYPKIQQRGGRLLLWFHWLLTALLMIGYICGKLSVGSWRLTPMLVTSLLVTLYAIHWTVKTVPWKRLAAAPLALVMAVSGLCVQQVAQLPTDPALSNNRAHVKLVESLEEQQLTYGFASFFNAGVITLLSDSRVQVRNVTIDDYGVNPNPYQSNSAWFKEQKGQERYFLLLSPREYEKMLNYHPLYFDLSVNEWEAEGGYYVLVFDVPPFEKNLLE